MSDDLRERLAILQSRIKDARRSLAGMVAERNAIRGAIKIAEKRDHESRKRITAARDSNLLRDRFNGMSNKDLAKKYSLSRGYVSTFSTLYPRNKELLAPDVIARIDQEHERNRLLRRARDVERINAERKDAGMEPLDEDEVKFRMSI